MLCPIAVAGQLFEQALGKAGGTIDADGKIHLAGREDEETEESTERGVRRSRSVGTESDADYADYDKPIEFEDVCVPQNINQSRGEISINEFTSEEIKATRKWAYKFYKELGAKSPFFRAWFGDWRAEEQTRVSIVETLGNGQYSAGKAINSDAEEVISWGRDFKGETINKANKGKVAIQGLNDIDAIIKNAVLLDTHVSMPTSKTKMPNTAFMHSFYVLYRESGGEIHLLKLFVEEALSNNGDDVFKRAYELKDIQKIANLPKSVLAQMGGLTQGKSATVSIADLFAFVKQYDVEFSPKSVNPAFLNEDGTPKVFYHGTNAEFYIFQKGNKRTRGNMNFGDGYYFTSSRSMAENYVDGESGRVMETYVAIRNPYTVYWSTFVQSDFDTIAKKLGDGTKVNSENVTQCLQRLGYDGIIERVNNGVDNPIRTVVAFESVQIKSANNNIGTFDGKLGEVQKQALTGKGRYLRIFPLAVLYIGIFIQNTNFV